VRASTEEQRVAEEDRMAQRRMMAPLNGQQRGEVEATTSWFGGLFG